MKVAILGAAGMQGRAVFRDLCAQDDVEEIILADIKNDEINKMLSTDTKKILRGFWGPWSAQTALKEADVAISCLPYSSNYAATKMAIQHGCHLVDLGGSNEVVSAQRELYADAREAGLTIIPDCGLAPGIPSILAVDAISRLGLLQNVEIFCGGLPQQRFKDSKLNYALMFSAEGLINEYLQTATILKNGYQEYVETLSSPEHVYFDEFGAFEADITSGGLSTIPETLDECIQNASYKTLRYLGHFDVFRKLKMSGLLNDKRFKQDLIAVLERTLPRDVPDIVLFRMDATTKLEETLRYEFVLRAKDGLSAMAQATGFSASTVALMIGRGDIDMSGVVMGEDAVVPTKFISEMKKKGIDLNGHKYVENSTHF